MPIKTIEVICIPCPRCEFIIKKLHEAIRTLEFNYKIKIKYEFTHTKNIKHLEKYSVNASQAPVVLINGSVEFAGKIEAATIIPKLDAIHKGY